MEAYLDKRARRSRIRHEHPYIIERVMPIEPIDRFARDLDESGPFLDAELESKVRGTRIADAHEHAPEDHVDAGVEEEQEPGLPRRVGPPES